VTLAFTGTSTSGQVARLYRMSGLQEHRLPLTGSRCDIRWLIGCGKTPTFCVVPVFRVAAVEKSCEACGEGERYFRSDFTASECRFLYDIDSRWPEDDGTYGGRAVE
jgi:hypothetical protein